MLSLNDDRFCLLKCLKYNWIDLNYIILSTRSSLLTFVNIGDFFSHFPSIDKLSSFQFISVALAFVAISHRSVVSVGNSSRIRLYCVVNLNNNNIAICDNNITLEENERRLGNITTCVCSIFERQIYWKKESSMSTNWNVSLILAWFIELWINYCWN